jgi:quinoprotein glucose dehydrogenase
MRSMPVVPCVRSAVPCVRSASWPAGLRLALALAVGVLAGCQSPPTDVEWRFYAGDAASSRYAAADQITADNVHDLEIAWRWSSPDEALRAADPTLWPWANESTPLMIGGTLYTSSSMSQVAAIDAATGTTRWVYDPESWRTGSSPNHWHNRGVAYWENGRERRIYIATGDAYLIALDANTGQPVSGFGTDGRVDLTAGLRRPVDRLDYGVSSPPIVCRDRVVVGSSITDYARSKVMPPGDVRGFDVRTGHQAWTFETIPQPGAVGNDTWENGSSAHTGNTNVWTTMSCDEPLGFVYLPLGTPSNDYYGGDRLGDNLFAESLVALDAATGARQWHFQMVHHGVWDYDLPAAPTLVDITVNGKAIRAVAQVSKQGFTYVFDRATGDPVWPIEERPVPQSSVPGERTARTQPFPTRPAPFDRQGITDDDLIDFTPELRAEAKAIIAQYDHGPLFTPPSERGTILLPGIGGGANYGGAAVDPGRGILYVPSMTTPTLLRIVAEQSEDGYHKHMGAPQFGRPQGPRGLPLVKPPYGRITAIDLNTGEHVWMQPVGDGPREHEAIKHLSLPPLGWARSAQVLLTRSLLFVGQSGPGSVRGESPRRNADEFVTRIDHPALRAMDPKDGRLIAEIPLPANVTGGMVSFTLKGEQYIVVPIGGASLPAELVALRLAKRPTT